MKSVINTLEEKLKSLEIELRVWSGEQNFSQKLIIDCNKEIMEHKRAIKILNGL